MRLTTCEPSAIDDSIAYIAAGPFLHLEMGRMWRARPKRGISPMSLLVGAGVCIGLVSYFGDKLDNKTHSVITSSSVNPPHRQLGGLAHSIFGAASYVPILIGTVSIIIVVVSVIAVEAAFELLNHLTHDTPFAELVLAVEKELMVVGSMAFAFKIIINVTTFINSDWLLGLEYGDILIPFITFSRCLIGVGLIYMSIKVCDSWGKAYHFHHLEILDAYLDKQNAWFTQGKLFFLLPLSHINAQMEFRIFHAIFSEHYMIQKTAFAFDEYVHRIFEKHLLRIIGMHELDWVIVCAMSLLNWARLSLKLDVNDCIRENGKPTLSCLKETNMLNFCYIGLALLAFSVLMAVISRYYEIAILASHGVFSCGDFAFFLDNHETESNKQRVQDKRRFNADDLKDAVIRAKAISIAEAEEKENSLWYLQLNCLSHLYKLMLYVTGQTAPPPPTRVTPIPTDANEDSDGDGDHNRQVLRDSQYSIAQLKEQIKTGGLKDISHSRRGTRASLELKGSLGNAIFFLGKSHYYFDTVCLMILPISFYLSLWITNFVTLSTEIGETIKWQFFSILPGLVSALCYVYITKVAALLLAITELDNDAVEEILEQTEGAHQLQEEMRKKILEKLEEIGNPREELKNLFESIDDNNSGLLSRKEFQTFLNELQISFSRRKWAQIYKEIDKDGSGELDYHELFLFIFPDSSLAQRLERKRIRDIQQRVSSKAVRLINAETKKSEKGGVMGVMKSRSNSVSGQVVLRQILQSTRANNAAQSSSPASFDEEDEDDIQSFHARPKPSPKTKLQPPSLPPSGAAPAAEVIVDSTTASCAASVEFEDFEDLSEDHDDLDSRVGGWDALSIRRG